MAEAKTESGTGTGGSSVAGRVEKPRRPKGPWIALGLATAAAAGMLLFSKINCMGEGPMTTGPATTAVVTPAPSKAACSGGQECAPAAKRLDKVCVRERGEGDSELDAFDPPSCGWDLDLCPNKVGERDYPVVIQVPEDLEILDFYGKAVSGQTIVAYREVRSDDLDYEAILAKNGGLAAERVDRLGLGLRLYALCDDDVAPPRERVERQEKAPPVVPVKVVVAPPVQTPTKVQETGDCASDRAAQAARIIIAAIRGYFRGRDDTPDTARFSYTLDNGQIRLKTVRAGTGTLDASQFQIDSGLSRDGITCKGSGSASFQR